MCSVVVKINDVIRGCLLSRDQLDTPLSHCQETSNGIITSVLALSARPDCTGPTWSAQGGVDSSA